MKEANRADWESGLRGERWEKLSANYGHKCLRDLSRERTQLRAQEQERNEFEQE